jgi:UDP-N-acetylmuramate--alanine ligase
MSSTKSRLYKHIRFLGAEGIGMSALTRILSKFENPPKISKSDIAYKQNDPLDEDIDLVVRSTAIKDSDPDLKELRARGIEVWHRRDMLNYLSEDYKQVVVSGTHGKTTCSAMLTHLMKECGKDPSYAVGGILSNYDSNGDHGQGEFFILEGDESDKSFTKTNPHLALVTCIEEDHLENYPGGLQEIQECFFGFLHKAGLKVINIDDDCLHAYYLSKKNSENIYTYSCSNSNADFLINLEARSFNFDGEEIKLELNFPGTHNFINAVGVIAAAVMLGLDVKEACTALKSFKGIKRRFELVNDSYKGSIKVYDDYAHHPTEVASLIQSIKEMNAKKLVFVYQPHHPERTKQLWHDFVDVFKTFPKEHLCLMLDIYIARSEPIEGINSEKLVQEINIENVIYIKPDQQDKTFQGNFTDIVKALKPNIEKALPEDTDMIFLVGAGNIGKIAEAFRD